MERGVVELVDTESLMPQEHLLRKVDRAVDLGRIYKIVEPLYSKNEGRPSVDPVVLFKLVLLQHLEGISSLRGTLRRAETDIAYRWFLGYTLSEELPHFSTVSYNFRHRFTEETIEAVFRWILDEVGSVGALTPTAVFVDGTHIKASANLNKKIRQEVPAAAKRYQGELLAEVNADREAHGKKPFDDDMDDKPPKCGGKKRDNTSKKKLARRKKAGFKTMTKSITDPDCGVFMKGKHQRQFAYEAHTVCDKNGYILEAVVTPGNVHDSVAFDDVYDKVTQAFPEIEAIVADSAYKTPHICKKVFDDGRVLSTAYKRPMTMKGGHEWWKYVYTGARTALDSPQGKQFVDNASKAISDGLDALGTQIVKTITDGIDNAAQILQEAEHKNNARPSTKNKHQEGQGRKKIDKGGEKGDIRRRPNPNKCRR